MILASPTRTFTRDITRPTADLEKHLYGFAMKRATADGWTDGAAKKKDFWLNQFSMKHSRFIARCVLHRASVCKDAANPSFRSATVVDVSLGSSLLRPRKPPPPPRPGTACYARAIAVRFGTGGRCTRDALRRHARENKRGAVRERRAV